MQEETALLREKRKYIRQHITERENKKRSIYQLKDFHFLSANLSRFMPNIPTEEHWDVYLNVLSTMMLRDFDVHLVNMADNLRNDCAQAELTPKIYITCHLGFCKASISLLILKGINKIALIVDENTYIKQADAIQEMHSKFKELKGIDYEIKIINVERNGAVLEIINLIKEGFSLFAYIDGNSGYKGVYNKEKTIKIPFLKSSIVSRTGLAAISYLTKTPIVPFISYYDENDFPVTEFLEEIKCEGENMQPYMERTTKKLYKIFESYIVKYYNQWESWFYFHKYLEDNLLNRKEVSFEIDLLSKESIKKLNLSTFMINENAYLFDKEKYLVYPITEKQFIKINTLLS
jgi:hypothetical protein